MTNLLIKKMFTALIIIHLYGFLLKNMNNLRAIIDFRQNSKRVKKKS